MLAVNKYPQAYVDACRSSMEKQLAAYRSLAKSAKPSALEAFEPPFFNNLVLVLDSFFVHRTRGLEKKDGNPLNEVRRLCQSILQNEGVLAPDKTIKFDPAKSVLKLKIGDRIKLTEADFVRQFKAFFAEIEAKFT
jgi:hypothetical protein